MDQSHIKRSLLTGLEGSRGIYRLLKLFSPAFYLSRLARYLPVRYLPTQIFLDSLDRPAYAFGIYAAAFQAKLLGYHGISAFEFGVAGGRGLLSMESLARRIGSFFGLGIEVHGFDTGAGLPKPVDYRDHPYVYRAGDFSMDVETLTKRLQYARLWLGPVAETLPKFTGAPVAFVSFDLDYYSSTVSTLRLFDMPPESRLPRVMCYFDDILLPNYGFFNERAGELLAIEEFNRAHSWMALSQLRSLKHTKPLRAPWHEQIYVLHDFKHEKYGDDIKLEQGRRQESL